MVIIINTVIICSIATIFFERISNQICTGIINYSIFYYLNKIHLLPNLYIKNYIQ